ncbi:putative bifunctional diguanylate cyclase/phosphodiesterase [Paenibacillus sp. strain BS8-2]
MIHIDESYIGWIVFVSFVIVLITSYSAIKLVYRSSHSNGKARLGWLLVSGNILGCGIWIMHFIGMIAFHMEMTVTYEMPLIYLSLFISIVACILAFYVTLGKKTTRLKIAIGGLILGAGIVSMHETAIRSMVMDVTKLTYDPFLRVLSFMIAIVASYAALYLFIKFKKHALSNMYKCVAAFLMGIAVTGMHYTGMKATEFWHETPAEPGGESEIAAINPNILFSIFLVMFVLVLIIWISLFRERRTLKQMAYNDALTSLPNRHAMNQLFEEKLNPGDTSSILYIDLDQFKLINDTLGHDMGDLLVQEVAERLKQFVSRGRTVFRLGGDEFLMLISDLKQQHVETLATQLLEELRRPYWLEGNELYITVSIGISYAPQHGTNRNTLLKAADTALYYAKSLGKNQYCTYNDEIAIRLSRRMEIEKGLRTALIQQQFTIHYQPKWNDAFKKPIGFEALLRWQHPVLGFIPPDEFIPVAEETGLIIPMTRWVMEQACKDCMAWNDKQGVKLGVSVNLSSHIFESRSLQEMIDAAFANSGIEPHLMELEITESTIKYYATEAEEQLAPLQKLGVRVSMDNFGSGFSFLGSIDRISFQTLKIDRLYMQDYQSPSKRAIVGTIIMLAKQLDIELIAEGVETEDQLEYLRSAGCSIIQGYYIQRPMSKDEVDIWIAGLTT